MATYYIDPTAPFDGNGLGPDPAASPGGLGARNVWPTSLANNTYLGKRGTSYKQTTTYISVNNNVVMDSYGDSTLPKHEIWSDSSNSVAVWVYASSSATIENMKFSGGSTRPFSVGASVNNLTVRGCEFSGTVNGTAISNTSCWLDGAGLSANGLKSESALPSSTPTFSNMTITGCLTNFILWDSTLGNQITLINCIYDTRVPPATSVVSIGPSWTLVSENNLYARNQTGMLTFLYTANIYGTLAAAQGAGYEVNSILGDPLLSSTNIPLLNSPVIGTGSHIKYTRDALNTQRPNPPSIGAYEYIEPRNTATTRGTRV